MQHYNGEIFYRRRLPHWQPPGATFFITFRLAGSLPGHVLAELREERSRLMKQPFRAEETEEAKKVRVDKRVFALTDAALGRMRSDAWLEDVRVAEMLRDSLAYWDNRYYRLERFVIMPNHVHVLIEPLPMGNAGLEPEYYPIPTIMASLKGYTARKANRLLRRTGAFWQDENYDHWVRSDTENARIRDYIDANPVEAGLCTYPHEWRWSSAHEELHPWGGLPSPPNRAGSEARSTTIGDRRS